MASNSNSPTQSATQQALGREYAIMLGAQPLSGLASLINWKNSTSHQRPALDPWGHIALSINSDASTVPATTEAPQPTAEPVAIVEAATPTIAPVALEPIIEAPAASIVEPTPPVQPAPTPPVQEIAVQAPPVAIVSEPVPPVAVASKPAAPVQVVAEQVVAESAPATPPQAVLQTTTPKVSNQVADSKVETAKPIVAESVPEKATRKESERVVAPKPIPQPVAETPMPESIAVTAPQSPIIDPPKVQIDKPIQSKTNSPEPKTPTAPPTKSTSIATPVSRPPAATQRPAASAMPEWKPTAKVARPTDATSSGDEYLRQLERLIIELNMELGMRDGDSPAQEPDQMSLLVQRMIDLNLQNLALKEQLREAASPTL